MLAVALVATAIASVAAGEPPVAEPPSQKGATAPPPASPAWTLGGEIFGDYYVVAAHEPRHGVAGVSVADDDLERRQGFWIRRVYLTYDHRHTPRLSTRVRLEANSAGDFVSGTRLEPFLKDASVRLTFGRHQVGVGLVPTTTIEVSDRVWGLRSVEKTPIDLYRFDSTRDLGVSVSGPLDAGRRWRYEAQVGNGAGVSSETNDAKTVRGAVSWQNAGLLVLAYADHQARSGAGDWTTGKVMAALQRPGWRAGGMYARQRRRGIESSGSVPGVDIDLLSAFAAVTIRERVDVFGRVDRVLDSLAHAGSIEYLPLSSLAPPTLWMAGTDIEVEGPLRFQPNVAIVTYGRGPTGTSPQATVMVRLTMAATW